MTSAQIWSLQSTWTNIMNVRFRLSATTWLSKCYQRDHTCHELIAVINVIVFPLIRQKSTFFSEQSNLNKENSAIQEIKKRTLLKISIYIDVNPNHIFPATKRKKRILFDCTTKVGTYVLMRTWPNMNRFFSPKPSRSFHIETKPNHAHSLLSAVTCTLVKK